VRLRLLEGRPRDFHSSACEGLAPRVMRLKKQHADVSLFLAVVAYLDGIVGLDLECSKRLLVD
jgi:hypothetical protein